MIVTVIACIACLVASAASAGRHLLSSPSNQTWQDMGPKFRAVTFVFAVVTLFLGLRLFFAAIDGVERVPPDATYGYAILAAAAAVDRACALWRIVQERKAWAVDELNRQGVGAFNGPDASGLSGADRARR